MSIEKYIVEFDKWYKTLAFVKVNNGPSNGIIAAALVVLKQLKENYDLNFDSYLAKGGAQIKGVSGSEVAKILKHFGETRPFAKEGGRTNRGLPEQIKTLLKTLSQFSFEELEFSERNKILTAFQEYLVERVRDFHNRQKIKLHFDPKLSTWKNIHNLLEIAKNEGKTGYVAQHLIGAKLQLRFPDMVISNESASTADKPTNRQGDFCIEDTIFHITVAPMPPVFEKCQANIKEGLKVYLLVPSTKLAAAREMAEQYCSGQVSVESLESFISQNVDEISNFKNQNVKSNFATLVEFYNSRVDEVEIDKSLMIELPANLNKIND